MGYVEGVNKIRTQKSDDNLAGLEGIYVMHLEIQSRLDMNRILALIRKRKNQTA